MQKPDFSTFNSKLLKEEEISRALYQVYKTVSEDPHDDRAELSEEVESKEEGQAVYDFEDNENQRQDVDGEVGGGEQMKEELIPALNQRIEEDDGGDDNEESFLEM